MAKVKILKKEFTIQQRNGESPDIHVTRIRYIPLPKFKRPKRKGENKPIDYGVTREQFHQLLDKASQPIAKNKGEGI